MSEKRTQGLVGGLHRIASAVAHLTSRKSDPRPSVTAEEKEDQRELLKTQMKQMAAQLGEYQAREKFLAEQNAHLEEQVSRLRESQEKTRQRLLEQAARRKILIEQNARLEERVRLSRDLHDSVKQQVFALAVQIELARSLFEQDSAAAWEHLREADELSYQIQQELTGLIRELRPAELQEKGLSGALRDYVTSWSRQSRITAELFIPEICLLPASVEEALWRVTQEALSNIARHSQASVMHLRLEWTEQQVMLSLSDNGQGFETTAHERKGFGLRSMRERIEQIGGTLSIQSARGAGTRLIVQCPLVAQQATMPGENEVTA